MNRAVSAAILATVIVGSSTAALADDKARRKGNPVVIESPAWVVPPQVDGDDYPIFAAYLGVNGSVSLECMVTPQGSPANCLVQEERPTGLGFGDAAKRIILRHRLTPRRVNGVATPAKFVVRLPFTADYDDPENAAAPPITPWDGPEPSAPQLANAREVIEAVGIPPVAERLGLDELPESRRAAIQAWAAELFPPDADLAEVMALGMARLWAKEALDRFVLGTEAPQITEAEANAAYAGPDFTAIDAEMKRRYCAAYDCGDARR
ncbi:Ferric siderophore transport system, periplasmic binding protein TonB [Brevundimonas diminuta 3F5N]|uniref:Ferric siderophore transport system, periplasmic binding protein TonB n=1 Tax=Brevundimonas diminuta 3F5N TaxID=1255603 RepID=A0A1R4FBK6_BREDI|nr:energy transducer TonB [Brevundimonas diminuta]SJM53211.1 Ferric siderophore transport system, periplasmic binding protein TonB [Brevundimonas diminuta 3F5N]